MLRHGRHVTSLPACYVMAAMLRHGRHVTSLPPCRFTLTTDSSLAYVVSCTLMNAIPLPFESPGIDWKPHCLFHLFSDPIPDSKKSVKRREIDNKALKKVLMGVMDHVRIGHVLPSHCDLLESAFRRGLVERGMPLDIGEGSFYPNAPWMRRRDGKDFVRPRLFLPYFEEAKVDFCFSCTSLVLLSHFFAASFMLTFHS